MRERIGAEAYQVICDPSTENSMSEANEIWSKDVPT
jgi:hypothetical protein